MGTLKGISQDEMHRIRLTQLSQVFAKADCALAGRRVTVEVKQDLAGRGVPAYTAEGRHIKIMEASGQNLTSTKGLVIANGLNYHELCHVMYTPGQGSRLYREVVDAGLHSTYNVLEDQRIESIITTKFPSTRPYLTATCAEYFIERSDDAQKDQAWTIISGRKYLPKNMRHALRSRFVKATSPKLAADFDRVIDEYRALRFGTVANKGVVDDAMRLIREYDNLLKKSGLTAPQLPNPFAHGPQTAAAGVAAGGNGAEVDAGVPAGAVDKADKASANGNDKGTENGAEGNGEGASDKSGGSGAGSGGTNAGSELDRALQSTLESVMNDTDVQTEIKSQSKTVNSRGRHFDGLLPTAPSSTVRPASEVIAQSRSFAKQLSRLVVDQDPGFERHKDSGRLNVNRLMRGDSLDSVFDQWSEGKQDAESLEVVVLVDSSGSMDPQMRGACEAVWAVKNAVDSLPSHAARCTVIKFDTSAAFLYRPNDRSTHEARAIGTGGGTNPKGALDEAYRILALTDRHKRILIVVSDGSWMHPEISEEVIMKINKLGAVTAALFLSKSQTTPDQADGWNDNLRARMQHKCHMLVMGNEVGAITKLGKQLVKQAIKG